MERLQHLTEGWIGGLVLLCRSLERVPESMREQYLSDRLDLVKKDIFTYFADQILAAQPPQIQEFLVKTALREVVEPGFIQDLLGSVNALQFLRTWPGGTCSSSCFMTRKRAGYIAITSYFGTFSWINFVPLWNFPTKKLWG